MASKPPADNETRAIELFASSLTSQRWLFLGFASAGAVAGAALAAWLFTSWEAVAVVQIGRIENLERIDLQNAKVPSRHDPDAMIEYPVQAVERMRNRPFIRDALAPLATTPAGESESIAASVKVALLRNTDMLELRMSASDPKTARMALQAVVERLSAVHKERAEPGLAHLRDELRRVDAEVERSEKRLAAIAELDKMAGKLSPGDKFSEKIVLASLLTREEEAFQKLKRRQSLVKQLLSPLYSFPTRVLSDQVHKSRGSVVIFGAAGFVLGTVLALLWIAVRRPRAR